MRVLIVDDERNIRRTFSLALESMNHEVSTASSGRDALDELQRANFDVVFLDLKLSQESGLDVLEEIVRVSPQSFVVIVTAYASVETAVEAMRRRAFDYLPKPCTPEQIRHVLSNVERTNKRSSGVWRTWNRDWLRAGRRSIFPRGRLRCVKRWTSRSRQPRARRRCCFLGKPERGKACSPVNSSPRSTARRRIRHG